MYEGVSASLVVARLDNCMRGEGEGGGGGGTCPPSSEHIRILVHAVYI